MSKKVTRTKIAKRILKQYHRFDELNDKIKAFNAEFVVLASFVESGPTGKEIGNVIEHLMWEQGYQLIDEFKDTMDDIRAKMSAIQKATERMVENYEVEDDVSSSSN